MMFSIVITPRVCASFHIFDGYLELSFSGLSIDPLDIFY